MPDCSDYAGLAEQELRAADLSISDEVRRAHAARAIRYAKLATRAADKQIGDIRAMIRQTGA